MAIFVTYNTVGYPADIRSYRKIVLCFNPIEHSIFNITRKIWIHFYIIDRVSFEKWDIIFYCLIFCILLFYFIYISLNDCSSERHYNIFSRCVSFIGVFFNFGLLKFHIFLWSFHYFVQHYLFIENICRATNILKNSYFLWKRLNCCH